MGKKKKSKESVSNSAEVWTEEQYEEYLKELYGMEFIAGFTENGVPYGLFNDEVEGIGDFDFIDTSSDSDEELPF